MPPFAVPPLSFKKTVTTALPLFPRAGVNVNVPVGPMAGGTAKRVLSLLVTEKLRVWADSSAGPALIALAQLVTVWAGPLKGAVRSGPFVKTGGSFTGSTETLTVAGALTAPA